MKKKEESNSKRVNNGPSENIIVEHLWNVLKKYGITNEAELEEALSKYEIDIGIFTVEL